MQVQLIRRLGQNQPGTVLSLSNAEGDVLIHGGHAKWISDEPGLPLIGTQPDPAPADTAPPEPDKAFTSDQPLSELRARAQELGLPTYGTKAMLVDRITDVELGEEN